MLIPLFRNPNAMLQTRNGKVFPRRQTGEPKFGTLNLDRKKEQNRPHENPTGNQLMACFACDRTKAWSLRIHRLSRSMRTSDKKRVCVWQQKWPSDFGQVKRGIRTEVKLYGRDEEQSVKWVKDWPTNEWRPRFQCGSVNLNGLLD